LIAGESAALPQAGTGRPNLFRHLLVPLDGSALAAAALPMAAGLAALCDAQATLLMVVPPVEDVIATPGETIAVDTQLESRRYQARQYLDRLGQEPEWRGLRLQTAIAYGRAAEEILGYADGEGVDLIVMTTHGRSGLGRWVWGSVAEKVLRAAHTPVLLLRSGSPEAPA
jgi:nucleotide-binding universal stress UspA family protein